MRSNTWVNLRVILRAFCGVRGVFFRVANLERAGPGRGIVMCMEILDLRLRFTSKLIQPDQPPYEQTVRGTPNRRRIFQKRRHSLVFSAPTSRPPASSARASSRAMPLGTGAAASAARLDDARFEAELSSRYADDDADDDAADAADAPGSALAPRDGLAPPPPPSRASPPLARDARSSPGRRRPRRARVGGQDGRVPRRRGVGGRRRGVGGRPGRRRRRRRARARVPGRARRRRRARRPSRRRARHARRLAPQRERRRGEPRQTPGALRRTPGRRSPPARRRTRTSSSSRAAANADLLRRHGPALDKKIRTGGSSWTPRRTGSGARAPPSPSA